MARPGKIRQIEDREGRPFRDILIDAYLKHGDQIKVARALGVSQTTVSLWVMRLGLREKTVLVPREQAS